ncbi:MAG: hypothetical protein IJM78_03285 [Prevotella sp.]|nr:hypothetical protein [Prevotella sp.]
MKKLLLPLLLLSATVVTAQQTEKTPAFPGAEGFGRYVTGGRGGTVYHVTNLNDSGTGSLRWALSQSGTKTIVFDKSGTIHLKSALAIGSNTTIAGQTAPGDGICLADYPVSISGNNVIVRYMRFRLGNDYVTTNGADGWDGFGALDQKNIMIDHCSVSWSIDECLSVCGCENVTVQWCLVAQSLRHSGHSKGNHGYGGNWGGKKASYHHNLLAHHESRTPRLGPRYTTQNEEMMDMRNNVIYNWTSDGCYGGEAMKVNMVNNYYKPGPGTLQNSTVKQQRIASLSVRTNDYVKTYPDYAPTLHVWGRYFIDGNVNTKHSDVTKDNWTYGVYNQVNSSNCDGTWTEKTQQEIRLNSPHSIYATTTHDAATAYERVLSYAGASLHRDEFDALMVSDTRNGKATYTGDYYEGSATKPTSGKKNCLGIINTPYDNKPANASSSWTPWPALSSSSAPADSDGDGMPDSWEKNNGLNANDKSDGPKIAANGYTNLENYLNSLVEKITTAQNSGGTLTGTMKYNTTDTEASQNSVNKATYDYVVKNASQLDAALEALKESNKSASAARKTVFLRNGKYTYGTLEGRYQYNVSLKIDNWNNVYNVSLIGESKDGVIIEGTTDGITSSTLNLGNGTGIYLQDMTIRNNYDFHSGSFKGVSVAVTGGNKAVLKNVAMQSCQDTYVTGQRTYLENCDIYGTVDFICGGGDIFFNTCNLILLNRAGNVIVAPNTASDLKWGYVFQGCTVKAEKGATNVVDKGWNLGRPWQNEPRAYYLNTKMEVLPSDNGWSSMGTLPTHFYEYNSMNTSGKAIDLSVRGNSPTSTNHYTPVLTATEAAKFTVKNVLGGTDSWQPAEECVTLAAPVNFTSTYNNGTYTLTWTGMSNARCYVIFKDGKYLTNVTATSYKTTAAGVYAIRAANLNGGLGKSSTITVTPDESDNYQLNQKTYTSTSGGKWGFNNGFTITTSKAQATGSNSTLKYSAGVEFTINVPSGIAIEGMKIEGYNNYTDKDAVVSVSVDGQAQNGTYTFPKSRSTVSHNIKFSNSATKTIAFKPANSQVCLNITLYTVKNQQNDASKQTGTFTLPFNDGTLNATLVCSDEVNGMATATITTGSALSCSGVQIVNGANFNKMNSTESKATAASTKNALTINITTKNASTTFQPTSITFNACKIGTDGGKIDVTLDDTKLYSGESPKRNNATSGYYSSYKKSVSSTAAREHSLIFNIYALNNKPLGLADIVLTGTVTCNRDVTLKEYARTLGIDKGKADVTLLRRFDNTSWTTVCLPFSLTADQIKSAWGETEIYAYTGQSGTTMQFSPVTEIEAGVPYMIKTGKSTEKSKFSGVNITSLQPSTISYGSYAFVGTYTYYGVATDGTEMIINSSGKTVTPSAAPNNWLSGLSAYFRVPTTSARIAKAKANILGITDDLEYITPQETKPADNRIYNLKGQLMKVAPNQLPAGIYIRNGKKFVIR